MKFHIELHFGGCIVDKFTVSARESGIVGCYHDGKPYLPDAEQVARGIRPAYLRKAVARGLWWDFGLCDTVRMDLWRKKDGAPMGTIFARFDSSEMVLPRQ